MTATTSERNTNITTPALPPILSYLVTAGSKVLAGCACAAVSGQLVPVTATSGGVFAGRANFTVDNSSTLSPQPTCEVQSGGEYWTNGTSTDAITIADVGGPAYFMDNQTVSRLNASGLRTFAGVILGLGDSNDPNLSVANQVLVWSPPPGFGAASVAAAIAAGTVRAASTVGVATLVAGATTVTGVAIATTSKVFLSRNVPGGTLGHLDARSTSYGAGTVGVGTFAITSSNATETSTIFYQIIT